LYSAAFQAASAQLTDATASNLYSAAFQAASAQITDATASNLYSAAFQAASADMTAATASSFFSSAAELVDATIGNLALGHLVATDGTMGSLMVANVDITPSAGDIVKERSFSAAVSVASPVDVSGFAFDSAAVRSFESIVSVSVDATSPLFAVYRLVGVQKSGTWVLNVSYVGDKIEQLQFSIDSTGQIKYMSGSFAGWVSTTMKFKASTTSL
jgi:hypothetical protein